MPYVVNIKYWPLTVYVCGVPTCTSYTSNTTQSVVHILDRVTWQSQCQFNAWQYPMQMPWHSLRITLYLEIEVLLTFSFTLYSMHFVFVFVWCFCCLNELAVKLGRLLPQFERTKSVKRLTKSTSHDSMNIMSVMKWMLVVSDSGSSAHAHSQRGVRLTVRCLTKAWLSSQWFKTRQHFY